MHTVKRKEKLEEPTTRDLHGTYQRHMCRRAKIKKEPGTVRSISTSRSLPSTYGKVAAPTSSTHPHHAAVSLQAKLSLLANARSPLQAERLSPAHSTPEHHTGTSVHIPVALQLRASHLGQRPPLDRPHMRAGPTKVARNVDLGLHVHA